MANYSSSFQWTGTAANEHDCAGVSLCSGSSFLAGFAHWPLVCHVQHTLLADEITGLCVYFTRRHTHIPSSENCVGSAVTGDVRVYVSWLPVEGEGVGGQSAMDGRGRL